MFTERSTGIGRRLVWLVDDGDGNECGALSNDVQTWRSASLLDEEKLGSKVVRLGCETCFNLNWFMPEFVLSTIKFSSNLFTTRFAAMALSVLGWMNIAIIDKQEMLESSILQISVSRIASVEMDRDMCVESLAIYVSAE